jgi:hypothetical protein
VYHICWAVGGWAQYSGSDADEVVAAGVHLDDEPFALLEEAVRQASDPELLACWQREHGEGVAVVLDGKGQLAAGPFVPPPTAECEQLLEAVWASTWAPAREDRGGFVERIAAQAAAAN